MSRLYDDRSLWAASQLLRRQKKMTSSLVMEPTRQGHSSVNIGSTVAEHDLLSAHAFSGCASVASYLGIGKTKVVKVL